MKSQLVLNAEFRGRNAEKLAVAVAVGSQKAFWAKFA
jgi:hypothetical protein